MTKLETTYFLITSIVIALVAFAFAFWLYNWVKKQPSSNARIAEIGEYIRNGANTFLRREYVVLARFGGVLAIIILVFLPRPIWLQFDDNAYIENIIMAVSYVLGTVFSAAAGKIGIQVSTAANVKTAEASKEGIKPGFLTGFRGGAVMGMAVVGASLLGVTIIFFVLDILDLGTTSLIGFSFGASSLALFAKAGGGIFTKTADISADLVGKVEYGIPEDDPRNPAVIADNVGDNVGDVAGMGADLFDSHVASLSAALVMAVALDAANNTNKNVITVFLFAAIGLLASIIGVAMARMGKRGGPTTALNLSTYITTGIFGALSTLATFLFDLDWKIWGASIVGLLVGVIIGFASDYYTNDERKPVQKTAEASQNGPAFTILSGISYGLLSVLPAMVGIGVATLIAFELAGMFGISIAAVGMLSIVGMIISNDAYGPIVDNARGLAEMGGLGEEVIETTDKLDSAGNTVKAITKGFAIGAAGLTVIALLGAFIQEVNNAIVDLGLSIDLFTGFDILDSVVFFGILIGGAVPAVFSAMLMLGVDRNAQRMIAEIHRQFNEIPGLIEGKEGVVAEYDKCIDIATIGALKELIPAGLFAILITLAVGFIGGVKAIGGFLAGNIIVGLFLALFMSNSGGLWDNGKKYIESGHFGGKGSDTHKAGVIGDTVGDPFKDTAGPSINTQITVVSLVSSLFSTIFLLYSIF